MYILVINCGSSSIKMEVVNHQTAERVAVLRAERMGTDDAWYALDGGEKHKQPNAYAEDILPIAIEKICGAVGESVTIKGVAHRIVHGGDVFVEPTVIDDDVVNALDALVDLAPLHMPANVAGVRAARAALPDLLHVAVFDTAFHATLPNRAKRYAIPQSIAEKHQIHRFGFHGPSHHYVARRAAAYMNDDIRNLRIITCHLGNGASVTAVEYGRSVETSMGTTPLEGLVMGTRSGDIDPGAAIRLARKEGWDFDQLDDFLNRESGLAGLSEIGNDLRDIEAKAAQGDEKCRRAIQVFAHRVRKYIGAYAAVMGGVDAIVFTAGIGENSALMRHRIAQRFDFLGARFNEDKNRGCKLEGDHDVMDISDSHSRVRLLVIKTDEEVSMARDTATILLQKSKINDAQVIPIAISARHVHLTQEHVEALFGPGHTLTPYKPLSQPGQYASEEKVTLVGPKNAISGVRVLGPPRSESQVEISRTDEFALGVDAPIRGSGDLKNTPGMTLKGPYGSVELDHGVICALRHIHMHPDDADRFGVVDHDLVEVGVEGTGRSLIFGDVLIRVSPHYKLEMHIDTDEGNAAELSQGTEGSLIETGGFARLRRKQVKAAARLEAAE